jgi:hypothetical protein
MQSQLVQWLDILQFEVDALSLSHFTPSCVFGLVRGRALWTMASGRKC